MHGATLAVTVGLIVAGLLALGSASGQDAIRTGSLKAVPVPGPQAAQLAEFVRDKRAAIALGKALFWDTRVGSDNRTACASCHFQAGADNRTRNQVNPGLLQRRLSDLSANPDHGFQLGGAPNYTLTSRDFPLTRHGDVNNAATRIADLNDVVSSQGVFTAAFQEMDVNGSGKKADDDCDVVNDALFHGGDGFNIAGSNTRRVEPRNSPTVINAVFNFRNFWDGRANNMFNGGDPFGLRNPEVLVFKQDTGGLRQVAVNLPSSALASQAAGPPLSGTEMSCSGRTFAKLGQKLLGQQILGDQAIAPTDSVLGAYAKQRPTYRALVEQAFQPAYWMAPQSVHITPAMFRKIATMDLDRPHPFGKNKGLDASQMEANFALFFGIAVQMYEATLVSDDSPFDRFAEGKGGLSAEQLQGLAIFQDKGRCINCHGGAEFTNAAASHVLGKRLESMFIANGSLKIYDSGFYNIGVRPTTDDLGVGGTDPFGNPLSETLLAAINRAALGNGFDAGIYDPSTPQRANVNGAFKTPTLRNVELTGPYFHNGGKATLMQVVDFYNRGGDFAVENRDNLAPDIQPLFLSEPEKQSLVAFLVALTDDRVRYSRAPFDHPSICMVHGHPGGTTAVAARPNGNAMDINPLECLQEVGAGGSASPLVPFLGLRPSDR
jgi:cytochrome c peroxidase